jgi:hypothetical protein
VKHFSGNGGLNYVYKFKFYFMLYTSGSQPGVRVPLGVRKQFIGVRGNIIHIKISPIKEKQKEFWGYEKRSILIWGYAKRVHFDLGVRE